uniref:Uncharacterized protein n=1 Tax=uncultured marine virus TaxID=186617 RepID=A0A0F7L3P9_9VIRU|nr:hypothetical protein [uncultured marine virus]
MMFRLRAAILTTNKSGQQGLYQTSLRQLRFIPGTDQCWLQSRTLRLLRNLLSGTETASE